MASISRQKDGNYSVRIGNAKYNGLSKEKAESYASNGSPTKRTEYRSDGTLVGDFSPSTAYATANALPAPIQYNQPAMPMAQFGSTNVQNAPAVDASIIGNQSPLSLAQPTSQLSNYGAFVSSLPLGDQVLEQDNTIAQAEQAKATLSQRISKMLGGYDPAKESARLERQYGINDIRKQLNDVNMQLTQRSNEYQQLYQNINQENAPLGLIVGQQAEAQKQASIELGGLAAMSQALQGNLQTSLSLIDRTLDLKYQSLQSQVQAQQFNLQAIEGILSSAEKKRAEALQIGLQMRSEELNRQKEQEQRAWEIGLEALRGGASQREVQAAVATGDPNVVAGAVGRYVGALDREQLAISRGNLAVSQGNLALAKERQAAELMQSVNGSGELLNLLGQYRDQLKNSNFLTARFDPTVKATLDSLKGQITAEYKKAEKLGTLDAGVQKLVNTIIPDATGAASLINPVSYSNSAQITAIDNFIKNQGGMIPTNSEEFIINIGNGKTLNLSSFETK